MHPSQCFKELGKLQREQLRTNNDELLVTIPQGLEKAESTAIIFKHRIEPSSTLSALEEEKRRRKSKEDEMAASPLVVLVACAIVAGGLATLVVVIAIAVDSWQEIKFDDAKIGIINQTDPNVSL